jgi:N6-L-threonylcarbamoyladenine synthase
VPEALKADLAASFQSAVVDLLVAKSAQALRQSGSRTLVVAGGVGANVSLRAKLVDAVSALGGKTLFPPLKLCTDNGAMIAFAAAQRVVSLGLEGRTSLAGFNIRPRWPLEDLR